MIRPPPGSTLLPSRRSSDLPEQGAESAKQRRAEGLHGRAEDGAGVRAVLGRCRRGEQGGQAAPRHTAEAHRGCAQGDRKSTRLNSSHVRISYAVFCLKKKKP